MSNDKKVTKIEEAAAFERLMQVFWMNLNVPKDNIVSRKFFDTLVGNTGIRPSEEDGKTVVRGVHINDALNVLIGCFEYFNTVDGDNGTIVITSILSVFNTFKNIRMLDFTFDPNPELMDIYEKVVDLEYKGDKVEMFNKLYNVRKMEIHLCDTLPENVVDFLNKMFIFYGYIPNDYMKRRFTIDFEFDEYVNFMNMLFSNNRELVNLMGVDIVNFLILFPVIVMENKPDIRIVTNYHDL